MNKAIIRQILEKFFEIIDIFTVNRNFENISEVNSCFYEICYIFVIKTKDLSILKNLLQVYSSISEKFDIFVYFVVHILI